MAQARETSLGLRVLDTLEDTDVQKLGALLDASNPSDVPALQQRPHDKPFSPLIMAVKKKNTRAVGLILDCITKAGGRAIVSTGVNDNLFAIALRAVFHENDSDLLYYLVKRRDLLEHVFIQLETNKQRSSNLHTAAANGLVEFFDLLERIAPQKLNQRLLSLTDAEGKSALHVATFKGNLDLVKRLVRVAPDLLTKDDGLGKTCLMTAIEGGHHTLIRTLVGHCSILVGICDKNGESPYLLGERTFSQPLGNGVETGFAQETLSFLKEQTLVLANIGMQRKRRLIFGNSQGRDMFLDLTTFNDPRKDFHVYIEQLKGLSDKLDQDLMFVRLPDLACKPHKPCALLTSGARSTFEASHIFKQLRGTIGGVMRVFEVRVPDCVHHPHADNVIVDCLRDFRVKILDWRKKDLSVRTILEAAPEVEQVHLYSSGHRDTLTHWCSVRGLNRLEKLQKIHLCISSQEFEDPMDASLEKLRNEVEEKLGSMKWHECGVQWVYHPDLDELVAKKECDCRSPRFREVSVSIDGFAQYKSEYHYPKHPIPGSEGPADDIWSKMMLPIEFLSRFEHNERNDFTFVIRNPVKIAILDSGVEGNMFDNIEGASFVENQSTAIASPSEHWHIPSNPHGTELAYLLRKMDPYCRLYAAKVHNGLGNAGVEFLAVTQAIDWAMKKEVDIILLSWTLPQGDPDYGDRVEELRKLINRASENILFFGSTGDGGNTTSHISHPAHLDNVIAISTIGIDGVQPASVERGQHSFALPSEGLEVVAPPYLLPANKKMASGSSYATALAAGVASLFLTFTRFALHDNAADSTTSLAAQKEFEQLKSCVNMRKLLRSLCGHDDHYVQPWRAFSSDSDDWENVDKVKSTVQASFRTLRGR